MNLFSGDDKDRSLGTDDFGGADVGVVVIKYSKSR